MCNLLMVEELKMVEARLSYTKLCQELQFEYRAPLCSRLCNLYRCLSRPLQIQHHSMAFLECIVEVIDLCRSPFFPPCHEEFLWTRNVVFFHVLFGLKVACNFHVHVLRVDYDVIMASATVSST